VGNCGASPPFGDPAPGRARLTARSPASVDSTTLLDLPFLEARVEGYRSKAVPPRRGVVGHVRRRRMTSDALCCTPRFARPMDQHRSRHRGPLPPLPRQRARLVRPRAPSIDKCSQRVALSRDDFGGSPPPVSRLCRRRPGFQHAFASPKLSPGAARPDVGSEGSSPSVATGRTPPVDFCNLLRSASTSDGSSEPRTPRSWSPTRAAIFRATGFSTAERIAGGPASKQSQSRCHGPGASSWAIRPVSDWHLPPRSLAAGASPQPDRLGHLMSRTRGDAGWSSRRRRASRVEGPVDELARRTPLSQRRLPGPPHATPREGDHVPPHPRCLSSSDHP